MVTNLAHLNTESELKDYLDSNLEMISTSMESFTKETHIKIAQLHDKAEALLKDARGIAGKNGQRGAMKFDAHKLQEEADKLEEELFNAQLSSHNDEEVILQAVENRKKELGL